MVLQPADELESGTRVATEPLVRHSFLQRCIDYTVKSGASRPCQQVPLARGARLVLLLRQPPFLAFGRAPRPPSSPPPGLKQLRLELLNLRLLTLVL